MASIADGYYYIRSTAGSSYPCLDVKDGSTKSGSNVQVYHQNHTAAQVWLVTTRKDGTRQITNRYSGKSIDVLDAKTTTSGQNVQLYNDNDTIAQQWAFTDTGETVTTGGSTYSLFYIALKSGYKMRATGASDNSNVDIAQSSATSAAVKWFFEPLPTLYSGGIYEIRSYLNTGMALDILDAAKTNGANLQLYYSNHTNAQKFIITESSTSGKWTIRNVGSNKYLDVQNNTARNGQNIQQYSYTGVGNQLWQMEYFGTVTVSGRKCGLYRIGSYAGGTSGNYKMDVTNASASAYNNVQIYEYNGTDAQLFALYPTDAEDTTMPTPYNLGLASALTAVANTSAISQETLYPAWSCSKAWAYDGSNHYEIRIRTRNMRSSTSSWNAWGSWTAWAPAAITDGGSIKYLTQGVDGAYDWDDYKLREVEFQVRCAGGENYELLHGPYADKTCRIYKEPDIAITAAGWTPEGLRLAWSTDYEFGTTYLNISGIRDADGYLFNGTAKLEGTDATTSATIPAEGFSRWPEDGTQLTIEYTGGYDQLADCDIAHTANLTVNYDAGTVSVEPTFIEDGLNLIAIVPQLGTERLWVATGNGGLVEAYKNTDYETAAGYTAFDVPYAFKETCVIFTLAYNSDGSQWGTDMSTYTSRRRAYGWNWDGGRAFLEVFEGDHPTHNFSETAIYEASALDNRAHESVSYSPTIKGTYQAVGVLTAKTNSSLNDFKALLEAGHAVYRDLGGNIRHVAVTGYTVSEHPAYGYTDISVTMIEETV